MFRPRATYTLDSTMEIQGITIARKVLPQSIVFRDMVWKVSKLQSGYNELCVYVEPYLTPCTSFVLGLLIFK
jgi:hypothetical protein